MNKPALYLSLLFSMLTMLLFVTIYKYYGHNVDFERNGLQFECISLSELVKPSNETQVVIAYSQGKKARTVYRSNGFDSNFRTTYEFYTTEDQEVDNKDLFVNAVNGSIEFSEKTDSLDIDQLVLFWTSPGKCEKFIPKRLIQYKLESGWFGFFDDSPFVFVIFVIITFVILWAIDTLRYLSNVILLQDSRVIIFTIFTLGTIFALTNFKAIEWYMSSFWGILAKYSIAIGPIFLVYQKYLLKFVEKYSMPDKEFIKHIFLFVGLMGMTWLGVYIGLTIDSFRLTNVVVFTPFYLPGDFSIGLIISFTLGNLLNNIRKNVTELSRSKNLVQVFKDQALEKNSELQALHSSINPHFLYNSLNSIASLASVDGEKAEKMALSLASFYKYVNNKTQEAESTIHEEIEMLDNYVEIEKIRFGEKLTIEFDIDPESLLINIPRFTLQPLLENAIKYGYGSGEIKVKICSLVNENELLLMVFDNGKRFDNMLDLGFGLRSVAKKLKLLYPNAHTLEFVNEPEKHVLITIEIDSLNISK